MARLCIIKIEINFNVSYVTLYFFLLIFCNFLKQKSFTLQNIPVWVIQKFVVFLSHIVTNIEALLRMYFVSKPQFQY